MAFKLRIVATDPPPEPYRWEIYKESDGTSIKLSTVSFRVANTALGAGRRVLAQILSAGAKRVRDVT